MQPSDKRPHISVMKDECLKHFSDLTIEVFYEGTLGAGGHARAILEAHPEIVKYIGCDRDPKAIELAKENLAPWKDKIEYVHGDFSDLDEHLLSRGINAVDGFFLTWGFHLCN